MRTILQKLADNIIDNLEKAVAINDEKTFIYFLNIGLSLDYFAIMVFNINLN